MATRILGGLVFLLGALALLVWLLGVLEPADDQVALVEPEHPVKNHADSSPFQVAPAPTGGNGAAIGAHGARQGTELPAKDTPRSGRSESADKARGVPETAAYRFVDAVTRRPLANVEVHANAEAFQTNSLGCIDLPKRLWHHHVIYSVAGYVTVRFSQPMLAGLSRVVPLLPSASVKGVVRDATGALAADRRVRLSPWPPPLREWADEAWRLIPPDRQKYGWSSMSKADGSYRLDGLPPGVTLLLAVSRRGTRFVERVLQSPLLLQPRESRPLDIRLPGRGAVAGVLVDQFGKCIGDAVLRAEPSGFRGALRRYPNSLPLGARSVLTDAKGRFRLDDLACGSWTIRPWSSNQDQFSERFAGKGKTVQIRTHGDVVTLTLTAYRGLCASGVVRDTQGIPVKDAVLRVRDGEGMNCPLSWTDKRGEFWLGPLPPNPVSVRVARGFGFESDWTTVRAGDRDVAIVVRRIASAEIVGTVLDGATGKPVPAHVRVVRPGGDHACTGGQRAERDGSFRVRVFGTDARDLIAYAKPDLYGVIRGIHSKPGVKAEGAKLLLWRAGWVRVALANADFRLLRHQLLLHVKQTGREYWGRPLRDCVTKVQVPPGSARIVLMQVDSNEKKAPIQIAAQDVQVVAGRVARAVLTLPPPSGH